MTKLLLVRHGQSVANIDNLFAGHIDTPLSPLGEAQAACTADFLVRTEKIDAVYASDLRRAFSTAVHTADKFGLPVTPVPALREIYAGKWENQNYGELEQLYPVAYTRWLQDIGNAVCTGGESVKELDARVFSAMAAIMEENSGKTVLAATHATPVRVMQCHAMGLPLAALQRVPWVSNASVTTFYYENGIFTLGTVSVDAHLGDLKTVLPQNV